MDCIGEYKAISQSDQEDRATNLKLAAQSINGCEIKPGETMSVNSLFGDTEHDDRYKMTAVINNAKLEEGCGGGICQVSTALYIAAPATDKSIFYITESSRTYYQDGVKMRSDHLSTNTYEVPPSAIVVLAEGSVDPTK
ncbi:MAG: VanW family protein [Raoultibacter sp.]